MYGSEKKYTEKNVFKKIAYTLLGEVHVPGRLRAYHIMKKIRELGLDKKAGISMLDAGCGRGDLVTNFARKYREWKLTGIELDKERLDIARLVKEKMGLLNADLMPGDLTLIESINEFDIIVSSDVLEHIENDKEVLKRLYKALKPGGTLLLTFPSIPQRKHLKLVEWREKRTGFKNTDYGHVRDGYSIAGVSEILESIGFNSITCQYTFGYWGTLCFDLFFVIGDNKPNPFVFLAAFPFLMWMAMMDLYFPSEMGSALLVTARK
jgi:ubiquinone/menaquinone biosynthesis C-methylase UbiE